MNQKKRKVHEVKVKTITPEDIYQELKSRKYFEKIFNDILKKVKETSAYNNLKDIALLHFTCIMTDNNESKTSKEIMEKKKSETSQIGFLSDAIGSSIPKLFSETIQSLKSDIDTEITNIISDKKQIVLIDQKTNSSLNNLIKTRNDKCILSTSMSTKEKDRDAEENFKERAISDESIICNNKRKHLEDSDTDKCSTSQDSSPQMKKPNLEYFSREIISENDSSFNEKYDELISHIDIKKEIKDSKQTNEV